MGRIKEGIAVKKDSLESLGIDNVERQVMVGDPVEEENSKPLAAEPAAQLAEKKLVVRVVNIGVDEVGDFLVI
jgi:hypothetical protein